jgi:hypothetical protein
MRLLFPVAMIVAAGASAEPATVTSPSVHRPNMLQAPDCPHAIGQFAGKGSAWRSDPLRPQKLTELPPADTYAAVYKRDESGCIVPVMYPGTRARHR